MFRKFWMVLGVGTPVYRHYDEDLARKEAERLARACPGDEFVVLESVGKVVKSDLAWDEPSEEVEIPF